MRSLMPEIEAFAEIGTYIDQPVRVYSSGMQMRLAFSVAMARRPDILIVDEALSVGDNYFQHKSFDRIRAYNKLGTTLLIVSHDKGAVQGICDRAILLSGGSIAMQGSPETVMDYYNAMIAERDPANVQQVLGHDGNVQTISGTGEARVVKATLCDEDGKPVEVVKVGQALQVQVEVEAFADLPELVFGYQIKDRLGQPVFGTNTFHLGRQLSNLKAGEEIEFSFQFMANFGPGTYSLALSLHASDNHIAKNYEWRDHALVFTVINQQEHFEGVAWLPSTVEIKR
jgi:lipopolysaccharide transport system ATP-binding protein